MEDRPRKLTEKFVEIKQTQDLMVSYFAFNNSIY